MALLTRTVSSAGDPLCAPDGTPLAGVGVTFTLVNQRGMPIDAWDALTHERVVGAVSATTDALGEFSCALWPTDRSNVPAMYVCRVEAPGASSFTAALPSGPEPLPWAELMSHGLPLSAAQLDVLSSYRAGFEAAKSAAVAAADSAQLSAQAAESAAAIAQGYITTYAEEMAAMAASLVQTQAIVTKHHGFT